MSAFEMSGEKPKDPVPKLHPMNDTLAKENAFGITTLMRMKSELKRLQEEHDKLEAALMEPMMEYGLDLLAGEFGRVKLVSVPQHEYPEDVKLAIEETNLLKKDARDHGKTKVTYSRYLKITPKE